MAIKPALKVFKLLVSSGDVEFNIRVLKYRMDQSNLKLVTYRIHVIMEKTRSSSNCWGLPTANKLQISIGLTERTAQTRLLRLTKVNC
jgi:hypothetical protein